MINDLMNEDYF